MPQYLAQTCPSLEELELLDNRYPHSLDLRGLAACGRLTSLHMRRCHVASLEPFGNCYALQQLSLSSVACAGLSGTRASVLLSLACAAAAPPALRELHVCKFAFAEGPGGGVCGAAAARRPGHAIGAHELVVVCVRCPSLATLRLDAVAGGLTERLLRRLLNYLRPGQTLHYSPLVRWAGRPVCTRSML